MALRLDIDDVRDFLGAWRTAGSASGLRARALATAMARDHLSAGFEVVVAQAYARPEHLDELALLASDLAVPYCEILLVTDVDSTLERFAQRGGPRFAEALEGPGGLDAIATFHERVGDLARSRPRSRFVGVIPGDVSATYDAMLAAVDGARGGS